jgi:hypothetical protein
MVNAVDNKSPTCYNECVSVARANGHTNVEEKCAYYCDKGVVTESFRVPAYATPRAATNFASATPKAPASVAAESFNNVDKSVSIKSIQAAYPHCYNACTSAKKNLEGHEEKCARYCSQGVFDYFGNPTQSSSFIKATSSPFMRIVL